jgi:uncharacterized protein YqeY
MLKDRISEDLKDAMRARDEVRLRTLRSLRAALLEREIAERTGGVAELSDEQALSVLQKQAKQRRDSIEQFVGAGREDLAENERQELAIIESYLPKQLSDDEIREELRKIIAEVGASSAAEIGKVMGPAMQRLKGKADGKRIQMIARELLS